MTTTIREETREATTSGKLPTAGRADVGAAGALLGRLFSAHSRMVLGLCRLLLRDPVEAEDAVQQVFLSAQRALVAGVVPRDPPAWLAAIARNECRARIRARMREPLGLPELPADLPDPLAAAIRAADLEAVWAALSELPRRQRKAFLLRELGGLSYGELGAALGVGRPAVESLLFRARQRLRDALRGLNAALVPLALRDQLARLIPDLGGTAAPAPAVPVAAKVAAVTAGLGLGAAGVAVLPRHHARPTGPKQAPAAVRPHLDEAAASTPVTPALTQSAPTAARPRKAERRLEESRGGHGDGRARERAEHRAESHPETEEPAADDRGDRAEEGLQTEIQTGSEPEAESGED